MEMNEAGEEAVQSWDRRSSLLPESEEIKDVRDKDEINDVSDKDDIKAELWRKLDVAIYRNRLTDLHTHLMGLGSADFWVTKILRNFLLRKKPDATIPLQYVMICSGFPVPNYTDDAHGYYSQVSKFESRFFDGFDGQPTLSFSTVFVHNYRFNETVDPLGIKNRSISVVVLNNMLDDEARRGPDGPLLGLVRNWFDFLNTTGSAAFQTDVLQICKSMVQLFARDRDNGIL
jgi:hypothetical protein